jgi:hypothetical protein
LRLAIMPAAMLLLRRRLACDWWLERLLLLVVRWVSALVEGGHVPVEGGRRLARQDGAWAGAPAGGLAGRHGIALQLLLPRRRCQWHL